MNRPTEAGALRVYLRRSLGEEQQAASLDTQRAVCERFARVRLLPWAERVEYVDERRHGDDFTRPGLQRLIAEAQAGDVVLAYDDSRVGRDALECARVIRDLVRTQGARLYYAASGTEASAASAIDDVMNVLRGLGAQTELEKIRTRTRDALRERAAGGHATGMLPYGYRSVLLDPSNPKSKKRIEIEPEAAATVRRIFEMFADGAGYMAIARRLNEEGVRAPGSGAASKRRARSKAWTASTIWDLLRNRFYRDGRGRAEARPPCPELAIIDEALWAWVSEALERRVKTGVPEAMRAAKHPLSGVLRCPCGGTMRVKICHGRRDDWKRTYYVCGRHQAAACSISVHLQADVVEKAIVGHLIAQVLPSIEAEIRAEIRAEIERAQTRTADVAGLAAEIARIKGEQRRLASAIASTDEPIPELIEKMKGNHAALARLEKAHAVATAPGIDAAAAQRIEEAAVAHLGRLRELLIGDRPMLREALKALFPQGLQLTTSEPSPPRPPGGCRSAQGRRGTAQAWAWWAAGEVSSHSLRTPDGVRCELLDAAPVRVRIPLTPPA